MDARDLAVFRAVARAGGMTRAARTLHTVQSNVTQRIRLLEAELGVPLFHRRSRGVTLTNAGEQLLPYAERIGNLIDEAKRAATNGSIARGHIMIGALETATAVRLPPLLSIYAAACPDVDIQVETGTAAELIEAVLASRVETAFVPGPVRHPDIVALPMLEEELVLVTAPSSASLEDITAKRGVVRIIVFRPGCSYRARLETLLADRGLMRLRHLEFGTLDGIIGCVGAGMGITMLPRVAVARAEAEGRVAVHRLPVEQARVETLLIRRHDAFVSTALARFIEIAREHLAVRIDTGHVGKRQLARSAGRLAAAGPPPDARARARGEL